MAEAHFVQCSRCGKTSDGLGRAPLAGDVGKLVYDHVCQQCWNEWFEQSVGVINHYGLNPALRRAAGRSVLAHLIDLAQRDIVASDGPVGVGARFRMRHLARRG